MAQSQFSNITAPNIGGNIESFIEYIDKNGYFEALCGDFGALNSAFGAFGALDGAFSAFGAFVATLILNRFEWRFEWRFET